MNRNHASLTVLLSIVLAACGGNCPEHTTTTSTTTTTTHTEGGDRPMLTAPLTVPESLSVTIGGLTTPGELDMRHVANTFGCTGENRSPELSWSGAPEGTQSFVVEMHDPDAPTGVGFFHWIVVDLPTSTTSIPFDGAANAGGISVGTDMGAPGYGGPCPPPGSPHRYIVTVYAVDAPSLGVDANASPAVVRFMLRMHTLAYGRAVATFGFPAAE